MPVLARTGPNGLKSNCVGPDMTVVSDRGDTPMDAASDPQGPASHAARADGLHRLHELTERLSGLRGVAATAQAVAEAARSLGFDIAVINLTRADGSLETIQVSGSDEARDALLGTIASREEWDRTLSVGHHYLGAVWQDHREVSLDENITTWVPDTDPLADDGWHPLDALFVPLPGSDGDLLGTLSVDLPVNGHRPEDHVLELLGMFGRQAAQALEHARLLDSLVARERELAAALARTEALLEAAPVAIIEIDGAGLVTRWNTAAERMLGWSQDEVLGGPNPAADHVSDGVYLDDVLSQGEMNRVHLRRRTKAGGTLEVELSTAVVRDADGVPTSMIGAMTDITERLQNEKLLRSAAFKDPLTGLANRAQVMQTLAGRLDDGTPTSLLLADLDGFKRVNDTFGHGVGDEVVVEMARRFAALPGAALVGRLGGDEFVLLCSDEERAHLLADAVVRQGGLPVPTSAGPVRLGASVGVTSPSEEGADTPTRMLRHSDVALYAAKADGRGCWRAWTVELEANAFSSGAADQHRYPA